jgi:hypothetical protein
MEQDDPEKRIAELERQLSDAKPTPRANGWRRASAPSPELGRGRTKPRRRWLIWGGVAAATVVVAIIAVVVVVVVQIGNALAPAHLLSADGLNGVLSSMRNHFGDTIGSRMYVFTDHALLDRADGRRNKAYEYDGRDWSDWDGSASSSDDSSVDLSQFDVAAVAAAVANAPNSLHFTAPEDTNLIVSGAEGELNLEVHLHDHGLSGWIELNHDGTIKKVHPPD